eukprot:6207664-Pleurochrysis_carterae.AAC.1
MPKCCLRGVVNQLFSSANSRADQLSFHAQGTPARPPHASRQRDLASPPAESAQRVRPSHVRMRSGSARAWLALGQGGRVDRSLGIEQRRDSTAVAVGCRHEKRRAARTRRAGDEVRIGACAQECTKRLSAPVTPSTEA